MQSKILISDQVEYAHLHNLASLLDDNNRLELEKLYYGILSDASIAFQQNPIMEGSSQTIDPKASMVYFRRLKCPLVWKCSSKIEYDILYEITCQITQKLMRDFLYDVGAGLKDMSDLPPFL